MFSTRMRNKNTRYSFKTEWKKIKNQSLVNGIFEYTGGKSGFLPIIVNGKNTFKSKKLMGFVRNHTRYQSDVRFVRRNSVPKFFLFLSPPSSSASTFSDGYRDRDIYKRINQPRRATFIAKTLRNRRTPTTHSEC